MISESSAREAILAHAQPLASTSVPLLEAVNRVASQSIFATVAYPGFDQSSMDGYAMVSTDSLSKRPLEVIGEQAAGTRLPWSIQAGQALRIFTGAPLPLGADAVIMQEDVDRSDAKHIVCLDPVVPLENVRLQGSEIALGQKGISAGESLSPAKIAWLASQGLQTVEVVSKPRLAIIATGDELIPPGHPLEEGQLYESNTYMLASMCQSLGFTGVSLHHCPDQLQATVELIEQLKGSVDVLLFSGGVSVGDHDHVKPALQAADFQTEFWRVAIKPGKPLVFATLQSLEHKVLAFGLPGNPVSAWVTFALFVKPCLQKLAGQSDFEQPRMRLPLAEAVHNTDRRDHFYRATLVNGKVQPVGAQVSHGLHGLSLATHLAKIPAATQLNAGEEVEVLPLL